MRAHCQPLGVVVEGNHGENLNHIRKNHTYVLVAVLSQSQLVRVQAPQQNLHDLNQILL